MPVDEAIQIKGNSILGFSEAAGGTESIKAIDPSNGNEIEPPFISATSAEVETAAALAQTAFLSYSKKSGAQRAEFLNEIALQIEALGDTLTQRAVQETGLPEARIKGETGRTTGQLRLFANVAAEGSWAQPRIDTAIPDRAPLPKPDIRSIQRPVGCRLPRHR